MTPHERIQITSEDKIIFQYLYQCRMLTPDHLVLLAGRSYEALRHRLYRLACHKYISRIERPFKKYVYVLGRAAVPILVEEGIALAEEATRRLRHAELKPLFIDHFLMSVDFHVCLILAAKPRGLKVSWNQGAELKDYATGSRGERLTVWPDGFFTLEGYNFPLAAFCFEADRVRGSKRDNRKIEAYRHYFEQGRFQRKYRVETFRLIRYTRTQERARNLCKLTGKIVSGAAQKHYLFTSAQNVSLKNPLSIFDSIFITPRDDRHRALLPSFEQSQELLSTLA
jgi:hypothetical protein